MRVAFDNQIFLHQKYGGISRSFCSLNSALDSIHNVESKIIAPIHINKHLLDSEESNTGNHYIRGKSNYKRLKTLVDAKSDEISRKRLDKFQPDILHETFYRNEDPWSKSYPRIVTVQDMIREIVDKDEKKSFNKRESIARAARIICISNNTKADLVATWKIDRALVDVIYLGVDEKFFAKKLNFDKSDSLLYVGQRGGYKNFENFIVAYSRSKFLRSNFRIVTFGGGPFTREEIIFFREHSISNLHLVNVTGDDQKLFEYYSKSAALVYPSKYEGFGLPIVEAMAAGSLVFCSNANAMREAGGDVAFYFNSDSVESITEELEGKLSSSIDLARILNCAQVHASNFKWENTAKQTLEVYNKVLHHN